MAPTATLDPALLADAPALTPQDQSQVLEPETPVVIVQRGDTDIVEKFDGREYVIPPGKWTLPYAVARHVQTRAIVPGSRHPHSGKTSSFIGILATTYGRPVDPAEKCRPFTPQELAMFRGRIEGLDRSALESPGAQQVEVVATNRVIAAVQAAGIDIDARATAPTDPSLLAATAAEDNAFVAQARADALSSGQGDVIGGRRRR